MVPPQFDFGPLPSGAAEGSSDNKNKENARQSSSSDFEENSPDKEDRKLKHRKREEEKKTPVKSYGYLDLKSKHKRNQGRSSNDDEDISVKWLSSSPVRPAEDCIDSLPRNNSAIDDFAMSIPIGDPATDLDNKFKSAGSFNNIPQDTVTHRKREFKRSYSERARQLFSPSGTRRSHSTDGASRLINQKKGVSSLFKASPTDSEDDENTALESENDGQTLPPEDEYINEEKPEGSISLREKPFSKTPSSPPMPPQDEYQNALVNNQNEDSIEDEDEFDISMLNEHLKEREESKGSQKGETNFLPKDDSDSEVDEMELVNYIQAKKSESIVPTVTQEPVCETVNKRESENFQIKEDSSSDSEVDMAAVGKLIEEREKQNFRHDFRNSKSTRTRQDSPERPSFKCIVSKPSLHRYVVTAVQESTFTTPSHPNFEREQLILTVMDTTSVRKKIYVRDEWLSVTPQPGDVIQVIGDYSGSETEVVVDRSNQNLFILHPDFLVNCTHIAESFYCQRKVTIRDRMRSAADLPNKSMLFGDIIHSLFQTCLSESDFGDKFMKKTLKELVENQFFETLLLIGLKVKDTLDELEERIPQLQNWNSTYFRFDPLPSSTVFEHRNPNSLALVSASKVVAIEEEIWSPLYGLKGKIDVTMQTTLRDGVIRGNYLSPFEIKTSTNTRSMSHRAQTTLYSLLLEDRYDIPIKHGMLLYSHDSEVIRIPIFHDEIRSLLSRRNEIAFFTKHNTTYPEMVKAPEKCRGCNRRNTCMILHKMVENGDEYSSGVDDIFTYETAHLTDNHREFFNHWNDLLDKEAQDMNRHLKEIWTMTSGEREIIGRCFGDLTVKPTAGGAKQISNGRYTYLLTRSEENTNDFNYTDSQLNSGDHIIVSDESGKICLTRGVLRTVNRYEIEIETYSALEYVATKLPGFKEENNQLFKSVLPGKNEKVSVDPSSFNFRIDKDEFGHAMALSRNNLVQLFTRDEGDHRRRELIVDKKEPTFDHNVQVHDQFSEEVRNFNIDQQRAIEMSLRAQDYTLLLGMPGTGKTTTIAALIRTLVAQNKTVLIASYTHSAVDNILLKIKDSGFRIARVGAKGRVHPEVAHMVPSVDLAVGNNEEIEQEVKSAYFDPPVVATTCLSINNWLFTKRKFDYCIIDEASQVTLPTCIGPLRHADKFILVGDHYQLSPLVKSADALDGGLDLSLFKYLCELYPSAIVNLEHQYRMCEDIMFLSNKLIYDGKLKCGTQRVSAQTLSIPDPHGIDRFETNPSTIAEEDNWLKHVMNEE